jgi:hypothetical protein
MENKHPDTVTISWADYCRLINATHRDINHALDSALRNEESSPGVSEMCRKEAKKNADMLRRLVPDWPAPEWWP